MDLIEQCETAKSRALGWLESRIEKDGSLVGSEDHIFGYYKGPLALSIGGCQLEADRVARVIKDRFFLDGRFDRGEQYEGAGAGPIYRDSWLTWGMHLLGHFDMSIAGGNSIVARTCRTTGAAFAHEGEDVLDVGLTCCAMTALLVTGHTEAAIKGSELVLKVINEQPEPSNAVYFRWSPTHGFVTASDRQSPGWIVRMGEKGEVYWYLGYCLVLMASMYQVTSNKKWLEGAERVSGFVNACHPEVFESVTSGKIGWGYADLHCVTDDPQYADAAERIGREICEVQDKSGQWFRKAGQPAPVSFDATFERVFYLTRIERALQKFQNSSEDRR
uniref:hypothetical protein n=1 Tax=Roseovarius indicus TaxID=540747 RepID=UPI003B52EB9D